MSFAIDILHNAAVEWEEAFSVVLGPQDPTNAMFGDITVTTVTIRDHGVAAGVVFPAPPVVGDPHCSKICISVTFTGNVGTTV